MKDDTTEQSHLVEVRGKVPRQHPAYMFCKEVEGRPVFKTVLDLATEAMAVRTSLHRIAGSGHSLRSILVGMPAPEVIVYLLGITQNGDVETLVGPKSSSPRAVVAGPPEQSAPTSPSPFAGQTPTPAPGQEIDDDDFLALSIRPGA